MSKRRLYVGNLPYKSCTDEALRELFAPRNIVEIKVVTDRETHRPRGFCFVEFATDTDAAEVIEQFNDMQIDGRKLVVNVAREPERGSGKGGGNGRRGRDDHGWQR